MYRFVYNFISFERQDKTTKTSYTETIFITNIEIAKLFCSYNINNLMGLFIDHSVYNFSIIYSEFLKNDAYV